MLSYGLKFQKITREWQKNSTEVTFLLSYVQFLPTPYVQYFYPRLSTFFEKLVKFNINIYVVEIKLSCRIVYNCRIKNDVLITESMMSDGNKNIFYLHVSTYL